jgi:hypothetical protein
MQRWWSMKPRLLTPRQTVMIAATRGILGVGLGLLISGRLKDKTRRGVGWTLFVLGAASTIPIAIHVFGKA